MKRDDAFPGAAPSWRGALAARAIRRAAAKWLALRGARGFTAAEQAAFAEWCAADPRHAAIFAECEVAWRTFDQLAAYPHSLDLADDPDLLFRARPRRGRRLVAPVLAAAAAIALLTALWLKPWSDDAATGAAPIAAKMAPQLLRLSDGSEVELNQGTEFEEHFTEAERRVRLVRGEAHFSVAKNPARPFLVEAGKITVCAVGTAFNVRFATDAVEVLVTEGRVQVKTDGAGQKPEVRGTTSPTASGAVMPEVPLVAGQRVVLPAQPGAPTPAPVVENLAPPAIERALAWQSNRLVFDAVPLAEVVARINRQSAGHIRVKVSDPKLGAVRISGRIRADRIDDFVEVLENNFGVVAERTGTGEVRLHRR